MTTTSDLKGLFRLLRERVASVLESDRIGFFLGLQPVPASRPRVTRWGTHYGKRYEQFRREAVRVMDGLPAQRRYEGPLMLVAEHVVAKPKSSKLGAPNGDVDNFAKSTLDALTKTERVYNDDGQVVALLALKRFADRGEDEGIQVDAFSLA